MFGAEVQSIKNSLDTNIVQADSFLHILLNSGDGSIQLSKAGAHGLDVLTVLLRDIRWDSNGIVKAQFHSGDIVFSGAGAQRA